MSSGAVIGHGNDSLLLCFPAGGIRKRELLIQMGVRKSSWGATKGAWDCIYCSLLSFSVIGTKLGRWFGACEELRRENKKQTMWHDLSIMANTHFSSRLKNIFRIPRVNLVFSFIGYQREVLCSLLSFMQSLSLSLSLLIVGWRFVHDKKLPHHLGGYHH